MQISVVIPTLDEAEDLPATLDALSASSTIDIDIVVVDGGSLDQTAAVVAARGARLLTSSPGRAAQLNAGAAATTGDPIIFLHADTVLDRRHLAAIAQVTADGSVAVGSFPIAFRDGDLGLRLVAAAANLRTRLDRTPYGDQAMFVRRRAFEAVGGFPDVPLMEDCMLGRRLRRQGRYVFPAGPPVNTSSRRYRRSGLVATAGRHILLRLLWEMGVSPHRLARLARRRAGGEPGATAPSGAGN